MPQIINIQGADSPLAQALSGLLRGLADRRAAQIEKEKRDRQAMLDKQTAELLARRFAAEDEAARIAEEGRRNTAIAAGARPVEQIPLAGEPLPGEMGPPTALESQGAVGRPSFTGRNGEVLLGPTITEAAQAAADRDRAQKLSEGYVEVTPEILDQLPAAIRPLFKAGTLVKPDTALLKALAPEPTKSPWGQPFTGPDGVSYQRNEQTGETRRTPGVGGKPAEAPVSTGLSDERQARLIRILPEQGDWQSIIGTTPTVDQETTRGGRKAELAEWATDTGVLLPDKKGKEAALKAKDELADIKQVQSLLADPEVQKDLGRYSGTLTNFLSAGWLGDKKVSEKTLKLRSTLNTISAKKRHEIYGAAVTGTEAGFAAGFIASLTQPLSVIQANVDEYADNIERGMGAYFGGRKPAEAGVRERVYNPTTGRLE